MQFTTCIVRFIKDKFYIDKPENLPNQGSIPFKKFSGTKIHTHAGLIGTTFTQK